MADPIPTERDSSSVKHADSDTLALLGKKQVLKRRFGFLSLFGFAVQSPPSVVIASALE